LVAASDVGVRGSVAVAVVAVAVVAEETPPGSPLRSCLAAARHLWLCRPRALA
jgi:hypothetical protein